MNDNLDMNSLAEGARNVRLSSSSKAEIRTELLAYARTHPAEKPVSPYAPFMGVLSPFMYLRRPIALFAVFFMVTGGATANAAYGSLPGEKLYALKVNVLEPVQGAFTLAPLAEAKWQAALAEARLNEAEQLAARSAFTAEVHEELETRFIQSVITARALLASTQDPEEAGKVAAELDLALAAHADLLATLAESTGASSTAKLASNVKKVAGSVALTAAKSATTSAATRGSDPDAVASKNALSAAQHSTVDAKIRLKRARFSIDGSTAAEAEGAIRDADATLSESKKKFDEKAYAESNAYALEARLLAEKTRLLLQVGAKHTPHITPPESEAAATTTSVIEAGAAAGTSASVAAQSAAVSSDAANTPSLAD